MAVENPPVDGSWMFEEVLQVVSREQRHVLRGDAAPLPSNIASGQHRCRGNVEESACPLASWLPNAVSAITTVRDCAPRKSSCCRPRPSAVRIRERRSARGLSRLFE